MKNLCTSRTEKYIWRVPMQKPLKDTLHKNEISILSEFSPQTCLEAFASELFIFACKNLNKKNIAQTRTSTSSWHQLTKINYKHGSEKLSDFKEKLLQHLFADATWFGTETVPNKTVHHSQSLEMYCLNSCGFEILLYYNPNSRNVGTLW